MKTISVDITNSIVNKYKNVLHEKSCCAKVGFAFTNPILTVLLVIFFQLNAQAQTVIASQNFEQVAALPNLPYTYVGGSLSNGTNGANGLPPNSNLFLSGSQGWQVINGTSVLTFNNQSLIGYSNNQLELHIGGMSLNSSSGIGFNDTIKIAISVDNGNSYSDELFITGKNNSPHWGFSASGTALTSYDGDNMPDTFQSATGTSGTSTLIIDNINDLQIKIKITLKNNDPNERWVIDDLILKGNCTVSAGTPFTKNCKNNQNGKAIGEADSSGAIYSWVPAAGLSSTSVSSPFANPTITTKYTVTKTDTITGCIAMDSVSVYVNTTAPTITCNATVVSCFGNANGTASVTVSAGTGPYTYLWNTGVTSSSITNLIASTYTVTVTGANGCSSSCSAIVTSPLALTINCNVTPISCSGGNNGSINAVASGGTPAYTYLWNTNATSSTLNNLGVGTYTVTVTDFNNCTVTCSSVIATPLPLAATFDFISSSVCKNETATLVFVGSNGVAPYAFYYKISNGLMQSITSNGTDSALLNVPTNATGQVIYNLLSLTDAGGCSQTQTLADTLSISDVPNATVTVDTSQVCKGGQNPIVTLAGTNGTPPYSFTYQLLPDTSTITVSTNSSDSTFQIPINTTTAETYTFHLLQVSTGGACLNNDIENVTVTINDLPTATANIQGTTLACLNSVDNPEIVFKGIKGTLPFKFTYNINGGVDTTVQTKGPAKTVIIAAPTDSAGTFQYNLMAIEDAYGCSQAQLSSVSITIATLPTASITGTTKVCQGATSPLISFHADSGIPPYTYRYSINGVPYSLTSYGDTSITANTNTVGIFAYQLVQIEDSLGCSQLINNNILVTVNPLPVADLTADANVVCKGDTVNITFNASKGNQPFTFVYTIDNGTPISIQSINNNDTTIAIATSTFTNSFTLHLISITDAEGCMQTNAAFLDSVTVNINSLPSATLSGSAATCQYELQPQLTFAGANGNPNYTFTYTIFDATVTDTNSLTTIGNNPANAFASTSVPGTYTYTLISVKDDNGCTSAISGEIDSILIYTLPTGTVNGDTILCADTTGLTTPILFTGLIGTPPYTFQYAVNGVIANPLSTVSGTGDTTVVFAAPINADGTFTYTLISVIDSNGCEQNVNNESATIKVNKLPTATITGSAITCENETPPLLVLTGFNGTAPYSITYNNGISDTTVITNVGNNISIPVATTTSGTTTYTLVSVASANGCAQNISGNATVTIHPLPNATMHVINAITCRYDTVQPTIVFKGLIGTPPFTFSYNINNGSTTSITTTGTDSVLLQTPTNSVGQFVYKLIAVRDSNGCTASLTDSVNVTINPLPTGTINVNKDSVCIGDVTQPTITFVAANGTPPYIFNYSINSLPAQDITSTGGGDSAQIIVPTTTSGYFYCYLNSITDALGCKTEGINKNTLVTVMPLPVITNNLSNLTFCNGDSISLLPFENNISGSIINWNSTVDVGFGFSGTGNIPVSAATNNDSVPVIATVTVYATTPYGCVGVAKNFNITVNPKPVMISVDSTAICSGTSLGYLIVSNFKLGVTYFWTSTVSPLLITGNNSSNPSINNSINDVLVNHTNFLQTFPYNISIAAGNCVSNYNLTTTVIPAPVAPKIIALENENNTVCVGSANITFKVQDRQPYVTYKWTSFPADSTNTIIKNDTAIATVITFAGTASPIKIYVTASFALSNCISTDSIEVTVINSNDAIIPRDIILKQPGNLLVYPDNTMDSLTGYQWGCNLIDPANSNHLYEEISFDGQAYQFFVPNDSLILNNQLQTEKYAFYVVVKNGECQSKIYYNGPYKNRPSTLNNTKDNTVSLSVFPNPATDDLNVQLSGNIYGKITATCYDFLGQIMYQTDFEKKQAEVKHSIKLNKIPNGIYLLELISSDHQKVVTRISIYH